MTTPSSSGNVVAIRSPREDDDAEAHADDPRLRAMRAVWLTMRDEDPPERGMAELLAAARVTAETMQARPTLWQRLVAGLRRPPALAFATVVVLVGGAVIVGRRGVDVPAARSPDTAGVAAPLAPSRPDGVAGNAVPGEATPQVGAADGHAATASRLDLASERAGRVEGVGKTAQTVTGAAHAGERAGPGAAPAQPAPVVAIPRLERGAAGSARPGTDRNDTGMGAADDVDDPMPGGTAASTRGAPTAGSTSAAAGSREPRSPPTQESPASSDDLDGAASAPSNEPPADAVEATKARVEPRTAGHDQAAPAAPVVPLEQLYKQCEAAARRGDCAAVRLMVARIAKSDRGYRARVAKGSPVAKCLAE